MTRRRTLLVPVLVVLLAVALAGCGDDGDDEEAGASTTTEASSSTAGDGSSTTEADGSTTTGTDGSTTTGPAGDLPGEPIDIYPYEGASLAVVGVATGDTLNVRSGPGTDFDVVTELGPLSQDAIATGQNRTVDDDSLWVEVEADGTTGWVNGAYVAEPGQTTDITAGVGAAGGETMADIGEAVAATRASVEEGPQPTVTVVDGPTVDGDGRITVDVIGLADDAVKGERLHIVAAPDASGEGFTVTSVEATALCARGVTAEGLCT
ncbi:MAG TPA: SH3 domain-containing protein [Iamia sp.]|nr:SH3 domain-containing protein [Iamia sp.]